MIRTLAALLLTCLATVAHADGKVFHQHNAADVVIPDQAAIIHFADGIETLVIDTRFQSDAQPTEQTAVAPEVDPDATATPYAWVVPLPAVPTEVFPVSHGTFNTLRSIFQPRVRTAPPSIGWFAVALTGVLVVLGVGQRSSAARVLALIGLVVTVIAALLLPALEGARAAGGLPAAAVTIHDQQTIGAYDTVIISAAATDPDAPSDLVAWLDDHGFTVDPGARAAIAAYVADGWCFVASRLRTDASPREAQAPHPLGFRFPVAQPVYPLRLTATHGRSVAVDLYVFAEGSAAAPGFEVRRSGATEYPDEPRQWWSRSTIVVGHEELRPLAAAAPVATQLSGTLTPEAMAQDATLAIGPFMPFRNEVRTPEAARVLTFNVGSVVLLVLTLVIYVLARQIELKPPHFLAACLLPIAISTLFGLAMHSAIPTIKTTTVSRAWTLGRNVDRLNEALAGELARRGGVPDDAAALAGLIETIFADDRALDEWTRTNPFTGRPRIIEASPGNLGLVTQADGVHLVLHDGAGMTWVSEAPLSDIEDGAQSRPPA
ncbi:MAG: DUF2330 domain-containing protein [Phycisphaerales bacterium]|nr:DUF2330 domain-containing protein [Phycisphaerales bacterium]